MKVHATTENNFVTDIKIVDIDVISDEEAQLTESGRKPKYHINRKGLTLKGPFRGFFVIAVLTFTGSDLPVGTSFIPVGIESSFLENKSWKVYKENKAFRHFRFSVDEYEEDDAKLKAKLRAWAEENGIEFYANSVEQKISEQAFGLYHHVVIKYCDEIFHYLNNTYDAGISDYKSLQAFLVYIKKWRFYINEKEFWFHGSGCSVMIGKEEICCWDFGHNKNKETDLHYLSHDEYKIAQTLKHIDMNKLEIKVLVMPYPKNGTPGHFPVFDGFNISRKLDVFAFGDDYVMTYDIAYDPSSQAESSFVHGELRSLILIRVGFSLEDDFTEYKYHFVPKVSDGGLVISNVKERYNSQTPIYIELLNTLRRYVDEFYGIGKQSGEV